MADQIKRSALSVVANIAEGNRRIGNDRTHHFRMAAGSADETIAHLRIASKWRYCPSSDISVTLGLLDEVIAILRRLTR